MQLSATGCILRITPSGESYRTIVCMLQDHGMERLLQRASKRQDAARGDLPDLYEVGEFSFDRKGPDKPAYLREFHRTESFGGIASNYAALLRAASISRFYERNLTHLEHFDEAWEILLMALRALSMQLPPDAVLIKALFRFARSEGYPVVAEWLGGKPPAERAALTEFLRQPLQNCPATPEITAAWLQSLNRYLAGYTDLLPGDP